MTYFLAFARGVRVALCLRQDLKVGRLENDESARGVVREPGIVERPENVLARQHARGSVALEAHELAGFRLSCQIERAI